MHMPWRLARNRHVMGVGPHALVGFGRLHGNHYLLHQVSRFSHTPMSVITSIPSLSERPSALHFRS
jgi:hypothetical protein